MEGFFENGFAKQPSNLYFSATAALQISDFRLQEIPFHGAKK